MYLLQGEQESSGSCFRMTLVPQLLKRSIKFPDLKEGYDIQKEIRLHNTVGFFVFLLGRCLRTQVKINFKWNMEFILIFISFSEIIMQLLILFFIQSSTPFLGLGFFPQYEEDKSSSIRLIKCN